jgi:hypothetical protein
MRFIKAIAAVCFVLVCGQQVTAQPFSIRNAPINIHAKVEANFIRNDDYVDLNATTTIRIGQIDALLRSFMTQVGFPDCSSGARWGYRMDNPRISQSEPTALKLSTDLIGCFRNPLTGNVREFNITVSVPVQLIMRGQYLALRAAGDVEAQGSTWFVDNVTEIVERLGKNKLRQLLAGAVEQLNAAILQTQINASENKALARFRPQLDGPPRVNPSLFGGALELEVKIKGRLATREVDAWLNPRPGS